MHPDLSAPFDWANLLETQNEGLRMEQEARHSFSVNARHAKASRAVENLIYPALERVVVELAVALTAREPDGLLSALRRLSSVGELARYEAEKLEGRA